MEIGSDPKVAYIGNDFHIFRAGILANEAGINDATHYHGNTPWYMIIPNGLRESVVTIITTLKKGGLLMAISPLLPTRVSRRGLFLCSSLNVFASFAVP